MKKNFTIFILSLLIASLILPCDSFAEEEGFVKKTWRKLFNAFKKPPARPVPEGVSSDKSSLTPPAKHELPSEPGQSPWEDVTEEHIRERIKKMLEITPGITSLIQELKVTMDKDKKIDKIEYNTDGIFKDIEKLDKVALITIHNRVNNERAVLQSQRIHKQLDALSRAAQNIPRPPVVYTPPTAPRPPTPPPAPPRIPTPPPAPPRLPRR